MFIGIDVHKRYSQIAVLSENGEIVEEVRVESANLDDFNSTLGPKPRLKRPAILPHP